MTVLVTIQFELKLTANHSKTNFLFKSFYYDVTLLKKLAKRILGNLVHLNPNDRDCDNTI